MCNQVIDWEARVKAAVKRESFTDEDKRLSVLWTTNPASELSYEILFKNNRRSKGPIDIYMVIDCLYFTKGVEEDDVALAKQCYEGIKKQEAALIAKTDKITRMKQSLGKWYK